jgi:putative membrane protein
MDTGGRARGRRFSVLPRLDGGKDPDYRFSLANERTFLAWIRTALALVAGGLAVVQLLPDLSPVWGRQVLGGLLVLLGMTVAAASIRRWARNEDALRNDAPLPPSRLPVLMALAVIVISVVAVVLLLMTGV